MERDGLKRGRTEESEIGEGGFEGIILCCNTFADFFFQSEISRGLSLYIFKRGAANLENKGVSLCVQPKKF